MQNGLKTKPIQHPRVLSDIFPLIADHGDPSASMSIKEHEAQLHIFVELKAREFSQERVFSVGGSGLERGDLEAMVLTMLEYLGTRTLKLKKTLAAVTQEQKGRNLGWTAINAPLSYSIAALDGQSFRSVYVIECCKFGSCPTTAENLYLLQRDVGLVLTTVEKIN